MSQTEDAAIENWIKLGVDRATKTGLPAIFWLNKNRAHDIELIKKWVPLLSCEQTIRGDLISLEIDTFIELNSRGIKGN